MNVMPEAPPAVKQPVNHLNLTKDDYKWLAYGTSGEAVADTDDVYGVAASILWRRDSPKFPNTIKEIVLQRNPNGGHEYQHIDLGKARHMPGRALEFASEQGQYKLAKTFKELEGRTNFKGQSELANRGTTNGKQDPMFHPSGNFFHHWWQEKGAVKPKNWQTPSGDSLLSPDLLRIKKAITSPTGLRDLYINK